MNYEDKKKYNREYYRKNADRLKAYQRAKYNDRKAEELPEEKECCGRCKRLSSTLRKSATGWCMKFRKVKRKNDICHAFLQNEKLRYEQPVHHISIFCGE